MHLYYADADQDLPCYKCIVLRHEWFRRSFLTFGLAKLSWSTFFSIDISYFLYFTISVSYLFQILRVTYSINVCQQSNDTTMISSHM